MMWGSTPLRPVPAHPYRDTLITYGAFGIVLGVIAWAAGASSGQVTLAAVIWFFAVAWSLVGWRRRIRAQARGEGLE